MITNTTAKSVYTITSGVTDYPIGFVYQYNPDNTPQIKVYIKPHIETPLVYGADYTISADGLNIELIGDYEVGDKLVIVRNISNVQLSDYVIGRIDPEQIEKDFDEAVMRDQQLQAEVESIGEMPIDHEARITAIEDKIPDDASPTNKLTDKNYVDTELSSKANTTDLATVATTGDYDDLLNKPSIPSAQVNSDWNANSGVAEILNKPTLGTAAAAATTDFATATQGAKADTAVQPADLATVATSGQYSDLTGTPPIPTVNDATLTITQGGVIKGTFTANASADVTIPLDAGGPGPGNAADQDLSNLTSTGANIPNWSTNVSNAIVEIPQDIKLVNPYGILVLGAGSKVYVPNGDGYDTVTIQNDISVSTQNITGKVLVFYDSTDGTARADILTSKCISALMPTPAANSMVFDILEKTIDFYDGTTTAQGHRYSLPLGEVYLTNGVPSVPTCVFNGFGYMAGITFVLPGLKVATADGLNTDGSFKSVLATINEVKISNGSGATSGSEKLIVYDDGIPSQVSSLEYDYKNNIVSSAPACILAETVLTSSMITDFKPRQVFHAASIEENVFNELKAQTGYVRLPNGILIQWGTESASSSGEKTVTFPVPFSSATSYAITKNYMSNGSDDIMCKEASFYSLTATSAKTTSVNTNSTSYQWIAIGY